MLAKRKGILRAFGVSTTLFFGYHGAVIGQEHTPDPEQHILNIENAIIIPDKEIPSCRQVGGFLGIRHLLGIDFVFGGLGMRVPDNSLVRYATVDGRRPEARKNNKIIIGTREIIANYWPGDNDYSAGSGNRWLLPDATLTTYFNTNNLIGIKNDNEYKKITKTLSSCKEEIVGYHNYHKNNSASHLLTGYSIHHHRVLHNDNHL